MKEARHIVCRDEHYDLAVDALRRLGLLYDPVDLLACPFCGAVAIRSTDRFGMHSVHCHRCLCGTSLHKYQEDADRVWNERIENGANDAT